MRNLGARHRDQHTPGTSYGFELDWPGHVLQQHRELVAAKSSQGIAVATAALAALHDVA
jgi:ABC-type spermidine/putrescine transport system permease subunit II